MVSRMLSFALFFTKGRKFYQQAWLSLLFLSPSFALLAEESLCLYRFTLPKGAFSTVYQRNFITSFQRHRAANGKKLKIRWLFSCRDNHLRTSQISELLKKAGHRGGEESIHNYEVIFLDQNIKALLFHRTRLMQGKKVRSLESYFATRNHEYHFYALNDTRSSGRQRMPYRVLTKEMKYLLSKAKFSAKVKKTITEADFRIRLYILAVCLALCVLLGLGALFWKIRKKRSPKSAELSS